MPITDWNGGNLNKRMERMKDYPVVLYGAGKYGKQAMQNINKYFSFLDVKYYIDDVEMGEYSLYNSSNINSTFITSFDGLDEGPHTFKAVATGKRDTNSTNSLIDCAKVIVYHAPYTVEDITLESSSYTLMEGAKQQINYTVLPDYAVVNEVEYRVKEQR